jgi:hypothetical protein
MTEKEILQLAKSCGFENWTRDKGECWECLEEQLLKFAWEIYGTAADETLQDYESKF